ncbi:MAG: hypothetical protein ACI8XB_001337 [Patiriisocius sp.]|jgi:hypothetical protein
MQSPIRTARIAGFIYLTIIFTGFFYLLYVPGEIIEWSDAEKTVENLQLNTSLYTAGIICGLICFTAFAILSLVLYKLLNHINKDMASLMVVLVLLSVPISFVTLIEQINVLSIINTERFVDLLSASQLQSEVMIKLKGISNAILIAQIFWGLWLLPFGYLVYHSKFIPKLLGVLLFIGCFGYLSDSIGYTLFPGFGDTWLSTIIGIPSGLGEIGICLWFLIRGVKQKPDSNQDETISEIG